MRIKTYVKSNALFPQIAACLKFIHPENIDPIYLGYIH